MSPDALVSAAQDGDHAAAAELFSRYRSRVQNYMQAALRSHADADEGTQQVFLRAFEGLTHFRTGAQPFDAWLFTVARNHAIDLRRAASRCEAVDPATIGTWRDRQAQPNATPADHQDREDVAELLSALPALHRQVLTLIYVYGLTAANVATVVERSPAAVRQIRGRALKALASSRRSPPGIPFGSVPPLPELSNGDRGRDR